jgi:hypothetical protein
MTKKIEDNKLNKCLGTKKKMSTEKNNLVTKEG